MSTQACLASLLVPVLWWILPCPYNSNAVTVVFLAALVAAGCWLALFLACIGVVIEENGKAIWAALKSLGWDIIQCVCSPGEFFRRKLLEDFNRTLRDHRKQYPPIRVVSLEDRL